MHAQVGELRSIGHTAPGLRSHLLDYLDADAFVVGITSDEPTDQECLSIEELGPRVIQQQLGHAHLLLDQQLAAKVKTAPLMEQAYLVQFFAKNDTRRKLWPPRFADQFLTRKACRDLVRKHEQAHNFTYDVYVRARLDMELLEDFPKSIVDHVGDRRNELDLGPVRIDRAKRAEQLHTECSKNRASDADEDSTDENGETITHPSVVRGIAAVPSGEDYGIEGIDSETGLMDKFLIGDAAAFEADASVWMTIINNMPGYNLSQSVPLSVPSPTRGYAGNGSWLMETLRSAQMKEIFFWNTWGR